MVEAKKYVLVKHFEGEPKPTDLIIVDEELPPLQDGEFLAKAEYFSVDPYMRVYSMDLPLGSTMLGFQIAKIVESRNPKFPVDKLVIGNYGWRDYTVVKPKEWQGDMTNKSILLPDIGPLSPSLMLGMLGMPGSTAYFGLLEVCEPKVGETIVVSGAAGAVGSHVGQIAKILGLTVIGICGSEKKCKWLTDELGFDHAINYKTESIEDSLCKAAPGGIDCYFDNVGGEISSTVIYQMKEYGRIAICGSISVYNDMKCLPKLTCIQAAMLKKQLKMEGFIVTRWEKKPQWHMAMAKNLIWIRDGKLICRETITKGFENIFQAFQGMLRGNNLGKAIVQV